MPHWPRLMPPSLTDLSMCWSQSLVPSSPELYQASHGLHNPARLREKSRLAEGECVGLNARIEEGDLECVLGDGATLADELVEPLFGHRAVALVVDVGSVGSARRLPVDEHATSYGSPSRGRSHDEMQVAGVEAVGDPPVGLVQHDSLSLHRPITSQGPMVESQPLRDGIDVTRVQDCTSGGGEVLGALIADIVFRRLQAIPVGGSFSTTGVDRNQFMTDPADSGLGQQLLNDHFGLFVFALAELMMSNLSLRVDEVEGWPVVVVEGTPDRIVVVDRDRIVDPQVRGGSADVVEVVLEVELRRVHADDHQSVILVLLGPRAEVGKGAEPVDAGVGPEVDQDDASAQPGCRQWWRVEPPGRAGERRQLTFNG